MTVQRRPSQRDIAQRVNVSQTVVSHVLNGKSAQHGIPKETEERVRAAIAELGYVPNASARSLRQGRNQLIGVHTFETLFPTRQNSYYYEIMVGVEERAIELGQDLLLLTSAHQHEGDQDIYHGGRNRLRIADGAIILGFNQDDAELSRLASEGFPFVFVGRREAPAALMPYVTADYAAAMRRVADVLVDHDHRRVAYLGLDDQVEPRTERRIGLRSRADEVGLEIIDQRLCSRGAMPPTWLREIIDSGATALVVEAPSHLGEVHAAAIDTGIDIPGDLSVIALDTPAAEPSTVVSSVRQPDWTHIGVPRREMGVRAVGLLVDLLDGRRGTEHTEELGCSYHGGSTLIGHRG